MHTAALAELGLSDWTYEAIEVAPEDFDALVAGLPGDGFAGVNVTVPHKLAALGLADEASEAATATGAANTLTLADGRVRADNTDVAGIAAALPGSVEGRAALVLGAGGSARAAVFALKAAGADVHVWNRTAAKAEALADELGVTHSAGGARDRDFDVLVNTTTVGMSTANEGRHLPQEGVPTLKNLPLSVDGRLAEVVIDLVYGSSETELIAAARDAGSSAIDGLEVLVLQGAESLRIWTGMEPPVDVMRAAARGAS